MLQDARGAALFIRTTFDMEFPRANEIVTQNMLELDTALNPGLSGSPILNRDGNVIGMAIGVLQSEVYGLAIRARDLRRVLEDAAARVRTEEARLRALGCDPGQVDGVFDARTWEAYGCERARKN